MGSAKQNFKAALWTAGLLGVVLALTQLPVFGVSKVSVTGLGEGCPVTEAEVRRAAGLPDGANIFLVNTTAARRDLLKNPYIGRARVSKKFPSEVLVDLETRRVRAYVYDSGNFIYIDGDGRVLDVKPNYTEPLPVVRGLKYSSYTKGELLNVEDSQAFNAVTVTVGLLDFHQLLSDVVYVDVSDLSDISLQTRDYDLILGDARLLSQRMQFVRPVLEKQREKQPGVRGTLDFRSSYRDEVATFRIMK
ncbi:MAG: FtsQ-type POTRA domain-containing protein [Clostridiales bacterium]|jgi:hypothetical protein|nr:FtsQ-type POTRA domain-containing protein [Clostridiales bacterium]